MLTLERARATCAPLLKTLAPAERELFDLRLKRSFSDLAEPYWALYGHRADATERFDGLLARLAAAWVDRPDPLRHRDLEVDLEPDWFLREDMVGYVFYLDRFNGNLRGLLERLDYLEELGVTYVHLMPCLKPRPGDSDGGYSVMDYRQINPALGTMADLETVAAALRQRGMSLCVDLVLNHTAKEHNWAQQARASVAPYTDYYWMFTDRREPDAYEATLVEIFPAHAPGNFTWYEDAGRWVWTTFNEHQWDLNWTNPQVMIEIIDVMLFLANRGVGVVRLDAVAFMWKRLGTRCQNEPEVHQILHALRAASRIAAPALIHKEEAIVSPQDLIPYLGSGIHTGKEGNLAYHNSLMVQFWSALATRSTKLMTHVLASHFPKNFVNATWATYLRCHDDIGWAITDEDAGALGISGPAHRNFLAEFYTGSFPGSFARGDLFQSNPLTGDKRNSGSLASLAGLESALEASDDRAVATAIQRILMGHALIASFGGVPLIYMGDELGLLNDLSYLEDDHHKHDSRWMHRPKFDWANAERRSAPGTIEAQLFGGIRHILARRKAMPGFHADAPTELLQTETDGIFAFRRTGPIQPVVALFNFTENWLAVPRSWATAVGVRDFVDHLSQGHVDTPNDVIALPPYARVWLT